MPTKAELQAEVDRLKRILTQVTEPRLGSWEKREDGSVSAPIAGPSGIVHATIEALARTLDGATNYTAISGWHPEAGRIECIVQRVGKLSPHDARVVAEQYLARAVRLLQEHGITWDGPTTFLPDQPIARPAPMGEREWLWIDVAVQPNEAWCQRCNARQPLPPTSTANIMGAILNAFSEQHAACQPGDGEYVGVGEV